MAVAATSSIEATIDWNRLSTEAWAVRNNARVLGRTMVGAAVATAEGDVFAGCNVEHRFRSHDVHAEVNALTTMAAAGRGPAVAIMVVSDRERFRLRPPRWCTSRT